MDGDRILLTGGTGFIGRRLLAKLLKSDCEVYLLARSGSAEKARGIIEGLGETKGRAVVVTGDVMRRGLFDGAADAGEMAEKVTKVVHLAAVYDISMPRPLGMAINYGGTENVLNFCAKAKGLERLAYAGTVAVSGRHPGIFREDDLDIGQTFRNAYDETKFLAEKLVRSRMGDIPTVIYRPTIVVGDSVTGEMDKIDGPYYALLAISKYLHLTMPDSGITKCHAAPVDFVVDAMAHLLDKPGVEGRAYCIGDKNPLTYTEFVAEVCRLWPRTKPLMTLPPKMVEMTFGIPGVSALTGIPKASFAYTYTPVEYTFDNLSAALEGSGIACPPVKSYLPVIVEYFKKELNKR